MVLDFLKTYSPICSTAFLCVLFASLPLNLLTGTLALVCFAVAFSIYLITYKAFKIEYLKDNWVKILVLLLPLFLIVFGLLYTPNTSGALNDLGRMFPLPLLVISIFVAPSFFRKRIAFFGVSLLFGTLLSAIICWIATGIDFLSNDFPFSALFSNEFASHSLAERIGVHTPYLAMFVNAAIFWCVYFYHNKSFGISKKWWVIVGIILTLFLFHLMARNAIFSFVLFGLGYLIFQKKKWLLLLFVGFITMLTWFAFTTEKNYLRDRFFKSINVFEKETIFSKKDNRFDRLAASYEVFKQFAIIGTGTAAEDAYRKEQFYKNRDHEAYNRNYNAHNQFMEYLSTYGLLGGVSFILFFGLLLFMSIKKRAWLVACFIGLFFIANLTESMFERSWGILFYSCCILWLIGWGENSNFKYQIPKNNKLES